MWKMNSARFGRGVLVNILQGSYVVFLTSEKFIKNIFYRVEGFVKFWKVLLRDFRFEF